MSLYAIGDVQGCYDDLQRLIERIQFDPARDHLWFVGDLVNRGPGSLEVLRYIAKLGDSATTVLGNHDLHLLAVAAGIDKIKGGDTFEKVLAAPDRDELLDWLRHRPLMHIDPKSGFSLLHAGLPPQWSITTARQCAAEVESVLRGATAVEFFKHMYGDLPDRWDDKLSGWDRLRFIVNCFTRLRYVDESGRIQLKAKGAPESNQQLLPWFRYGARLSKSHPIVFGHWSTLGLVMEHNVFALDTGCVWGGALTALKLDKKPVPIAVDCPGARKPDVD